MTLSTFLIPYIPLGIFSALALLTPTFGRLSPKYVWAFLGGVLLSALGAMGSGILDFTGLLSLFVFAALYYGATSERAPIVWKAIFWISALVLAVGFYLHRIPGFYNWVVIEGLLITPNAAPYTMFVNFDKTSAALILFALSPWLIQGAGLSRKDWPVIITTSVAAIVVLSVLSFCIGYIHWAPKFPEIFWPWVLNNFLFVSFAETVLFRGVIQTKLHDCFGYAGISPRNATFSAILVAAILYGCMASIWSGPLYGVLVGIVGLFYGYVYARTNSLLAAVLVQFSVNAAHILLFTYPSVCA